MRTLTLKLTLAFLLVGLTGAIMVAVIVQQRTRSAFDQFLRNQEQQNLATTLLRYYQVHGNWEGLTIDIQPASDAPPPDFSGDRGSHHGWMPFTLVGPDRRIVTSSQPERIGQQIPSRDLDQAIPLIVDNQIAGWLLPAPPPRVLIPNTPAGQFIKTVNSAAMLSSLVAAGLALILGGLLAYTLTRSLRELTEATEEIARGNLGGQVKVRTKDELGTLALSFNKMSQDLARATKARRQMTADIAHDLRSPLSVIAGYAEALSDGKLPGTSETYNILYNETRHLNHLVEDLRLLSLADAGELVLNLVAVSPRTFLDWVVARQAVSAQQNEISLRVEAEAALPQVEMDEQRMAQVYDNLIMNSFRYTPRGGEIILAANSADDQILFKVRDNGSGITPDDLPHIFDRFYRGDSSRQQNGESGLGLAIAKSIVEAQGGSISVESSLDSGTVFIIKMPVAKISVSNEDSIRPA